MDQLEHLMDWITKSQLFQALRKLMLCNNFCKTWEECDFVIQPYKGFHRELTNPAAHPLPIMKVEFCDLKVSELECQWLFALI